MNAKTNYVLAVLSIWMLAACAVATVGNSSAQPTPTATLSAYQQAEKAYEATMARPAAARQAAIANVRAFGRNPNLAVEYKSTAKSAYGSNVISEFYVVADDPYDYYEVDTRNDQIVQFGPSPLPRGMQQKPHDTTPRFSPEQLEQMARTFITERTSVNLSSLTPNHGNKGETNYFFRWENRTQVIKDGGHPLIQVGFTRGGDLLSYTNTLNMPIE